jgi:hypothetical protein
LGVGTWVGPTDVGGFEGEAPGMGDIGDKKRKTIEVLPASLPEPTNEPSAPRETPRTPVPAAPARTQVG